MEDIFVNVHHQITTTCVLHYKAHMLGRLETGKELDQERMLATIGTLKDSPLA